MGGLAWGGFCMGRFCMGGSAVCMAPVWKHEAVFACMHGVAWRLHACQLHRTRAHAQQAGDPCMHAQPRLLRPLRDREQPLVGGDREHSDRVAVRRPRDEALRLAVRRRDHDRVAGDEDEAAVLAVLQAVAAGGARGAAQAEEQPGFWCFGGVRIGLY